MAWEDGIEQQIVPTEDKTLFKESVKCLNAQCFRAGYVVAWLSIVESLKTKIAELANGEKQAEISTKKIENEEAQNKSVDKTIIAEAKICNIIDAGEQAKLLFLWAERCKFAHPYQQEPTEDELKYILSQSVVITLGKPLLYKKNFIDEFIEDISTKPHYFATNTSAISQKAIAVINRITPELHPYFLKSLMAKLGETITDESKMLFRLRYQLIIKQLYLLHKGNLDLPVWGMEAIAIKFPATIIRTVDNVAWPCLPDRIKDVIVQFLLSSENGEEEEYGRYILKRLNDLQLLETPLKARFYKFLDSKILDYSYQYYAIDDHFYNQIKLNIESAPYANNNSAITALESSVGVELFNQLSADKKFELGRLMLIKGSQGSYKVQNYIKFKPITDPDLLAGLLDATFIATDETYRFRSEFLGVILGRIKLLQEVEMKHTFAETLRKINLMQYSRSYNSDGADILRIHSQQNEGVFSDLLLELANALAETPNRPATI